MTSMGILTIFLLITLYIGFNKANVVLSELDLSSPLKVSLKSGYKNVLCYQPAQAASLTSLFQQDTIISITLDSVTKYELPWFSVQGVSTDDLHTHMEHMIFKLFAGNDSQQHYKPSKPYEVNSFIRDVVSSCPNPLFARDRKHCDMRFSSMGRACITVTVQESVGAIVEVSERVNTQYIMRMIAAVLLLYLAPHLAKSKMFQYSTGCLLFALAGAVLILFMIFHKLFKAKGSSYSFLESGVIAGLLLSYGASLIYYLREHFQTLILHYWEAFMLYYAVATALGLGVTRALRSSESSKHVMTVLSKWLIRGAGVVSLYNAFPSPLLSMIAIALSGGLYIFYAFNKWVIRPLRQKTAAAASVPSGSLPKAVAVGSTNFVQ